MKKIFWIVVVVTLALTNLVAFAEEDFIPEEWVTLEEARTMYAEAIGEDTFELTIHSSYWWEETTDGWYQFDASYNDDTGVGMNVRGEHVRVSDEALDEFESHGAYLQDDGRFTIDPELFPWHTYLSVDSAWGEILLEKWIVDEFVNHCVESKEAAWISLEEATQLFEEALGVNSFKVTCQHAFWVDSSTVAWIQIQAGCENVGSASALKISDIRFPIEKLKDYGVTLDDENQKFIIDPENPSIHSFDGIEITSEWGDVYLSRECVETFLDYCITAWSDDVAIEE